MIRLSRITGKTVIQRIIGATASHAARALSSMLSRETRR